MLWMTSKEGKLTAPLLQRHSAAFILQAWPKDTFVVANYDIVQWLLLPGFVFLFLFLFVKKILINIMTTYFFGCFQNYQDDSSECQKTLFYGLKKVYCLVNRIRKECYLTKLLQTCFWAPIATRGALSNSVFLFCFVFPISLPQRIKTC